MTRVSGRPLHFMVSVTGWLPRAANAVAHRLSLIDDKQRR
jgi:hypothetical protein